MKNYAGKVPAVTASNVAAMTFETMRKLQDENERLKQQLEAQATPAARGRRSSTKRKLVDEFFWHSNEANPVMREAAQTLKRRDMLTERAREAHAGVIEAYDGVYPDEGDPHTDKQGAALLKYFHAVMALNFNAEIASLLGRYNHHMDADGIIGFMSDVHEDLYDGPPTCGFSAAMAEAMPEDSGIELQVKRRLITNAAGEQAVVHEATFSNAAFYHPGEEHKVVLPYTARRVAKHVDSVTVTTASIDVMVDSVIDRRFKLVDMPKTDEDEEYSDSSEDSSQKDSTQTPSTPGITDEEALAISDEIAGDFVEEVNRASSSDEE